MSEYGDFDYGFGSYGDTGEIDMIDCLPQVHICQIRVADLLPDGVPEPGSATLLTVDSIVEIGATPVVRTGAEINETNGCGATCIDYQAPDSIPRWDLSIIVCDHNPWVMQALGGGNVVTDNFVNGYAFPALGEVGRNPKSIEFLAKRIEDGDVALDNPYAWWVMPLVTYLRQGPFTKNNGADRPTFVGRAFENPNWFDGPLNDWPVTSDRWCQWFPVSELWDTDCEPTAIIAS